MVESFSAYFLPAIERYWAESHLKFCQNQRRSFSAKGCEALLDDWADGGYGGGRPRVW